MTKLTLSLPTMDKVSAIRLLQSEYTSCLRIPQKDISAYQD